MSFVNWSNSLSVGVKEIDDQHRELFIMINKFHEIDLEKEGEAAARILSDFIEFTRVHFTTEEDFFKQCAYQGAEEHIKEHIRYIEDVLQFQRDYAKGEYSSSAFLSLLKEWWENHLKIMDKGYVKSFHDCGLK